MADHTIRATCGSILNTATALDRGIITPAEFVSHATRLGIRWEAIEYLKDSKFAEQIDIRIFSRELEEETS